MNVYINVLTNNRPTIAILAILLGFNALLYGFRAATNKCLKLALEDYCKIVLPFSKRN